MSDVAHVQQRTVRTLFASQVLGGVGVGISAGVGSLLVAGIGGSDAVAGLGGTASTLGGAVVAYPMAALMARRGRRPGLSAGYLLAVVGAALTTVGAALGSIVVVLVAMTAFGAANATTLQARYAATDLAEPARRGRSLAVVVWATTIGAVAGPNLIAPSDDLGRRLSLPGLTGPFLFSALAFALAVVVLQTGLRPDPLLRRAAAVGETPTIAMPQRRLADSLRAIGRSRLASVGLIGMVVGQVAMTGVMAMTPVHMRHTTMGSLHLIGLVISVHIAGMFALSPLVGWAADRFGALRVLAAGPLVLWLSALCAGLAPDDGTPLLTAGLFLLGLGWSICLVTGSSLLSAAMPESVRAQAQGAADLTMGLLGALGGALAGVVQDLLGYADLNLATAVVVAAGVVAAAVVLRRAERPRTDVENLSSAPSQG